jgi:pantoate kinase
LRGSKGVGVTIESYGKVEISYINVDKTSSWSVEIKEKEKNNKNN